MKKMIILVLFVLVSNPFLLSQIDWLKSETPPNGEFTSLAINSKGDLFIGSYWNGIYKSVDNGKTWQLRGIKNTYIHQIIIDNNDNILVVTDPISNSTSSQSGLYISTNDGVSFKLINNGFASSFVRKIAISKQGDYYASTTSGIYHSTNLGVSWKSIGLANKFSRGIIVDNNGAIYAGVDFEGIYKSLDKGVTWQKTGTIPPSHYTNIYINPKGDIFVILFHEIPFYGQGIYRSTDKGNTWEEINNGIISPHINKIISISNNELIASGNKGYIYSSNDNGNSWKTFAHFSTTAPFTDIETLPDNTLITSSDGFGLIQLSNKGDYLGWYNSIPYSFIIRSLVTDPDSNIYISSGLPYGTIFRSQNNGKSWNLSSKGLPEHTIIKLLRSVTGKLFACTYGGGLYASTDKGVNWYHINVGPSSGMMGTITQNKKGVLFVSFFNSGGGIFSSKDDGSNWQKISIPYFTKVRAMAINPNDELYASNVNYLYKYDEVNSNWILLNHLSGQITLLAVSSNYIYAQTDYNNFYRSADNGQTFEQIKNLGFVVTGMIIYPDKIIVGTDGGGILKSIDNGDNWVELNDGLQNLNVTNLTRDVNEKLYAGTTNGLYISKNGFLITNVEVNNITPEKYSLKQNYPNPFNPTTTISFSVPKKGFVSLTVTDLLGRKVAELVNEEKPQGNYTISFDANKLSSGIYFYTLSSGKFVQTKKMILLR